jgi:hypothetical protein
MRVVALAFALTVLVGGTAAAGCWGTTHTVDAGKDEVTTAEAPIQTPVPETKTDS